VDRKDARINAVATWLLEFSVLLMVFPTLDALLQPAFNATLVAGSVALAVASGLLGVYLRRGGD
jgi:hypothetical protein